jgi:alpha-beta hydrolase superfamily lysophospholipase
MKHEEMQWQTKDALPLYAQRWEPDGEVKGVICLVHGIGEHSGRYLHWAERLTAAGYVLSAIDLRGHGKSGGARGDSPSYDHFADDISIMVEEAAKRFPGKPLFLYGHSLGGLLVAFYLIQRRPKLSGAIITSPSMRTALEDQKVKVVLARILGTILPTGSMATGLEQDALSQDPAVIAAYRDDPLVHDKISFRMGKQSLMALDYVKAGAKNIDLPLLLMHGSADRITFMSGSEELADLVSGECTLKICDGLYHELHNEKEKDEVFGYLKTWLDEKSQVS